MISHLLVAHRLNAIAKRLHRQPADEGAQQMLAARVADTNQGEREVFNRQLAGCTNCRPRNSA